MRRQFDELNEIGREPIDYNSYFSVMELSEKEMEERIELAKKLEPIFLFFLLAYAKHEEINYASAVYDKYVAVALGFLKMDKTPAYISDYARKLAKEIVQTTEKHDGEEYYTSNDRAMLISANEANTLGNYRQYAQAVKSGMKYKTWVTERDSKVRKTHRAVDGATVGIFDSFIVGGSSLLFPRDTSQGAGMELISNCRCAAQYS